MEGIPGSFNLHGTDMGVGAKILHRVDIGIAKMLREMNKGWPGLELLVSESDAETVGKENTPKRLLDIVDNCSKCRKFMWKQSKHLSDEPVADPTLCPICRRNRRIQSRLEKDSDEYREAPKVEVSAVLCASSGEDRLDFNSIDNPKSEHKRLHRKLEVLRSNEQMNNYAKRQHLACCVALLDLYIKQADCIKVTHRGELLGVFKGHVVDLVKLVHEEPKQRQQSLLQVKPQVKKHAATGIQKHMMPEEVPLVSVCVQGGPNTVDTVRNAVVNSTPSLLVKGSGKAACLMSDAVLLKCTKNLQDQKGIYDNKQHALSQFFTEDLQMKRDAQGSFDYKKLVARLKFNTLKLKNKKKYRRNMDWPRFRREECAMAAVSGDLFDPSSTVKLADRSSAEYDAVSGKASMKKFVTAIVAAKVPYAKERKAGQDAIADSNARVRMHASSLQHVFSCLLLSHSLLLKQALASGKEGGRQEGEQDDSLKDQEHDSLEQAMSIELAAGKVVEDIYNMGSANFCATEFLRKVVECADTDKCSVFRLRNTLPDALVRQCLLCSRCFL